MKSVVRELAKVIVIGGMHPEAWKLKGRLQSSFSLTNATGLDLPLHHARSPT